MAIKLKKLDEWNEKRRQLAARYDRALKGVVATPVEQPNGKHVYHLYVIRVEKERRDAIVAALNESGIESRVYYPVPLHLQECYKDLGYRQGDFPEAEKTALETIMIPIFPELKTDEQDYIIDTIKKYA